MWQYFVVFVAATVVLGAPGSKNVDITDVPYQVSVQYNVDGDIIHICGGVILSEKFVISAAQCTNGFTTGFSIRANTSNLNDGTGQVENARRVTEHPEFKNNYKQKDYDLVIFELENALELGEGVAPVALPEASDDVGDGTEGLVTGWGFLDENGERSPQLQAAESTTLTSESCANEYADYDGPEQVTERMVCAKISSESCTNGDLGNALVIDGVLYGLTSWGSECKPEVFSSLAGLRDFVNDVAGL